MSNDALSLSKEGPCKECSSCHKIKSLQNFYKQGDQRYESVCKKCKSEARKKRVEENKNNTDHLLETKNASDSNRTIEEIYSSYGFTSEEFSTIVRLFQLYMKWDQEINKNKNGGT